MAGVAPGRQTVRDKKRKMVENKYRRMSLGSCFGWVRKKRGGTKRADYTTVVDREKEGGGLSLSDNYSDTET